MGCFFFAFPERTFYRCLMTIQKNIAALFNACGNKPLSVTKIQGDASSRQYFRVNGLNGSAVACYDATLTTASAGTHPFLVLHNLFSRHKLPVPAIMTMNAEQSIMLLEDCGDLLLQNLVHSSIEPTIRDLYKEIIDMLIQIQAISGDRNTIPFSISFDREKLMFEFDFFIQYGLLDYFAPVFDAQLAGKLRNEFETISELLVKPEHFVLNHRDFHSRNILVHHNKPVIIDFQDARMGLPQYDAVSLLKDSYVHLSTSLTDELKRYHYHALCSNQLTSMSFDEYLFYFDISAFQRNIKAIGTFCYQTRIKKNNIFEHSIAPTLSYLPEYIAARNELKTAGELLKTLLDGARQ
jgi:aminoglycoside/choline kinase family phosphotransferase